jgi:hypothetical protein
MVQVHKLVHMHRDSLRDSQYRDSWLTGLNQIVIAQETGNAMYKWERSEIKGVE